MLNFLYSLSAFMTPETTFKVIHRPGPSESWPVTISIGDAANGGQLDMFSDLESTARLRDALTACLEQADEEHPK